MAGNLLTFIESMTMSIIRAEWVTTAITASEKDFVQPEGREIYLYL